MTTLKPEDAANIGTRRATDLDGENVSTRLSRSPRPYARGGKQPSSPGYLPSPALTPSQSDSDLFAQDAFSGTEADDEIFQIKTLPAPLVRPRKGLRDEQGEGYVEPELTPEPSPLATPRWASEKTKSPFFRELKTAKLYYDVDQEKKQKRIRKRNAEIRRRSAEALSLAWVSYLVCSDPSVVPIVKKWRQEFLLALRIMLVLCLFNIVPLLLLSLKNDGLLSPVRLGLPTAFDPAPLLYPVLIPVTVSLSLATLDEAIVLPNLVLGISSIPSQLIPLSSSDHSYSQLHWAASLVPTTLINQSRQEPPHSRHVLDKDQLALLFPVHQSLLQCLNYLTTTSLLPSELQLLSTTLVNLLLLASSPQSIILSHVLWIGGVGLFILCLKPLEWNVALERIPIWKLRRGRFAFRASKSFLSTLSEGLCDEEDDLVNVLGSEDERESPVGKVDGRDVGGEAVRPNIGETTLALCHSSKKTLSDAQKELKRSRTRSLPGLTSAEPNSTINPYTKRRKRALSSQSQPFLSLSPKQATQRKLLYTGYTYSMIVGLIIGPLWILIRKDALNDYDPALWAIGYLFGDSKVLQAFAKKQIIFSSIPIPSSTLSAPFAQHSAAWIDSVRFAQPGPANTRLLLFAYWALVIALALATVLALSITVEVDTRRKVFHGTMVVMLLPTAYIDPPFLSLGLALVLAVFLLLELCRAAQLRPLSKPLAHFLTPYVDGRDLRGPVVVSHIFLLIGCAIPFWLSMAGVEAVPVDERSPWNGWEVQTRDVSMVAGVICVGLGDAAASLIGRRIGRRKWPWLGGKSLEGSAAFMGVVTAGLLLSRAWLEFGGWKQTYGDGSGELSWGWVAGRAAVCAAGASFTEAVLTGCNDNVIVPVVLWLLVRALRV